MFTSISEARKQKLKELNDLATVRRLIDNCRIEIKLRSVSGRLNHP